MTPGATVGTRCRRWIEGDGVRRDSAARRKVCSQISGWDINSKARSLQRFSDDGNTITGHWEIAEDGTNYTTDFDLTFSRVDT